MEHNLYCQLQAYLQYYFSKQNFIPLAQDKVEKKEFILPSIKEPDITQKPAAQVAIDPNITRQNFIPLAQDKVEKKEFILPSIKEPDITQKPAAQVAIDPNITRQNFIPLAQDKVEKKEFILPSIKEPDITQKPAAQVAIDPNITRQNFKNLSLRADKSYDAKQVSVSESLDSLRLRIHECQECNLCLGRKNIVYGQGNQRANLLIIGEAPGAEEDKKGIPFVGKAGQLLDKMLLAIAVAREAVYVTNLVKCRPPNNRNPYFDEMQTCFTILKKQINFISPQLIVLLGSVAFKWIFPQEGGIIKNHGKLFSYTCKDIKIPTIATFHPAYLLRKPEELPVAWQDFRKIRQLILRLGIV